MIDQVVAKVGPVTTFECKVIAAAVAFMYLSPKVAMVKHDLGSEAEHQKRADSVLAEVTKKFSQNLSLGRDQWFALQAAVVSVAEADKLSNVDLTEVQPALKSEFDQFHGITPPVKGSENWSKKRSVML